MSYADFTVSKEHKFLRNIFSEQELSLTESLKNIEQYHKMFETFLKISVYLQNSLNTTADFSKCYDVELIDFCNELCADCSKFIEIKERVSDVTIKNQQGSKIPKFMLQVYQRLMDFPHKIINVKTHLHNSHITGKIVGYAHDFRNAEV